MTDPQNDKPCRDCKRPTQHATEICDDCRTPAGRLVTALAALGVKATAAGMSEATHGTLKMYVWDDEWSISSEWTDGDEGRDAVDECANAIAAIVQAPGLRAELTAIRDVLIDQGARPKEFLPPHTERTTLDMLNGLMAAGNQTAQEFMDLQREHAKERGALVIERDTLAAEVKRLREELEKPVAGAWLMGGDVPYRPGVSGYMVAWAGLEGWMTFYASGKVRADGRENGDAGKHAADLALLAAGYRLVGGVHPLPDEVRS